MSPSVKPFNEAKYKALVDGLESSEIFLSDVLKMEDSFRIDSEFYQKQYVTMEKDLEKASAVPLKTKVKKIDVGCVCSMVGEFTENSKDPILLQTKNIDEFFVNETNTIHINQDFHNRSKKSQIHYRDVLIARSGSFGKASIYLEQAETNSSDIIIVETKDDLNPFYLTAFLNSRLGKLQLCRFASGGVQGHVNLTILEGLKVPVLGRIQDEIEKLVQRAYDCLSMQHKLMLESEQRLISQLCFNFPLTYNNNTTAKKFSESFLVSGRFDAEYYQSKYEHYESAIKSNKNGFTCVRKEFELVNDKCDRTLPQYPYVEIGDINIGNGVATPNIVQTENLPDNAKIMTKENDIIISTVRPNRGAIAILDKNNLLVSGAFTVLRENADYPKEVLQALLRLEIYRDWLLKYNVGTSYPVIKNDDILNLPIPILDRGTQNIIVNNYKQSLEFKQESNRLLALTTKLVEMAIETSEDNALLWLKSQG